MRHVLIGLLGSLWLTACGAPTRESARDTATLRACDQLEACVSSEGKSAPRGVREQCEAEQRVFWENQWNGAACEGRINADAFDACLVAIDAYECDNSFDLANIVSNKCTVEKVCSGTKSDGGS